MADVRPINANELRQYIWSLSDNYLNEWSTAGVLAAVESSKTLDYEPVRHAEWIPQLFSYGTCKCSRCGWRIPYSEDSTLDARNYCPNCGAKMDGGASDG